MSKSPKSPIAGRESPPVSHLDQKITQAVSGVGGKLKRFRTPFLIVASALVVSFLVYGLVTLVHSSHEEALAERLYLLMKPKAGELPSSPPVADLDKLVQDARGASCERFVLKAVAQTLADTLSSPGAGSPGAGSPGERSPEESQKTFSKLEEYARLGKERFPGDDDMQAWSKNLLDWVNAQRDFKATAPEKRAFTPVLPKPAPVPSSSAAPSGAPSAAPAAAAPSSSPSAPPPPKTDSPSTGGQPPPGK